jgi:hypothetical protein
MSINRFLVLWCCTIMVVACLFASTITFSAISFQRNLAIIAPATGGVFSLRRHDLLDSAIKYLEQELASFRTQLLKVNADLINGRASVAAARAEMDKARQNLAFELNAPPESLPDALLRQSANNTSMASTRMALSETWRRRKRRPRRWNNLLSKRGRYPRR